MNCPQCEHELSAEAKWCTQCGTATGAPEALPVAAPALDVAGILEAGAAGLTAMNLVPDLVLDGRFRLIRHLGAGGMGDVWLGHDAHMGEDVAIKVLKPDMTSDKRAIANLKREARLTRKLTHPNIVRLYDFHECDGIHFISMEYVDGQSLSDELADHEGPFEPERALPWLEEIGKALDYAHSEDVLHRDVKPGNILLGKDGSVKLADFGIARVAKDNSTRVSGVITEGTLLYMSPEQLMGGPQDRHCDLYSFAATAYDLLSGNPPFHSGDISRQIALNAPNMVESLDADLNAVLQRGLAKKPKDRYESCTEFYRAMAGLRVESEDSDVPYIALDELPTTGSPPPLPQGSPLLPPANEADGASQRRRLALVARREAGSGKEEVFSGLLEKAQQALETGENHDAEGEFFEASAAFEEATSSFTDHAGMMQGRARAMAAMKSADELKASKWAETRYTQAKETARRAPKARDREKVVELYHEAIELFQLASEETCDQAELIVADIRKQAEEARERATRHRGEDFGMSIMATAASAMAAAESCVNVKDPREARTQYKSAARSYEKALEEKERQQKKVDLGIVALGNVAKKSAEVTGTVAKVSAAATGVAAVGTWRGLVWSMPFIKASLPWLAGLAGIAVILGVIAITIAFTVTIILEIWPYLVAIGLVALYFGSKK